MRGRERKKEEILFMAMFVWNDLEFEKKITIIDHPSQRSPPQINCRNGVFWKHLPGTYHSTILLTCAMFLRLISPNTDIIWYSQLFLERYFCFWRTRTTTVHWHALSYKALHSGRTYSSSHPHHSMCIYIMVK